MAPDTELRSDRFLKAFNAVDKSLRRCIGTADKGASFSKVVKEAAEKSRVVKRYKDDLLEYAELRNAIVHNGDGRSIAEPHLDTVTSIEQILNQISAPPKLCPKFAKNVEVCKADDPVATVAKRMLDNDFSQLPVYAGGKFVGLLTAEAVARWFGDASAKGGTSLQDVTVDSARKFVGKTTKWEFVKKTDSVFDALHLFSASSEKGEVLVAILITESGRDSEKLLGIITPYDIPALIAETNV